MCKDPRFRVFDTFSARQRAEHGLKLVRSNLRFCLFCFWSPPVLCTRSGPCSPVFFFDRKLILVSPADTAVAWSARRFNSSRLSRAAKTNVSTDVGDIFGRRHVKNDVKKKNENTFFYSKVINKSTGKITISIIFRVAPAGTSTSIRARNIQLAGRRVFTTRQNRIGYIYVVITIDPVSKIDRIRPLFFPDRLARNRSTAHRVVWNGIKTEWKWLFRELLSASVCKTYSLIY